MLLSSCPYVQKSRAAPPKTAVKTKDKGATTLPAASSPALVSSEAVADAADSETLAAEEAAESVASVADSVAEATESEEVGVDSAELELESSESSSEPDSETAS
jgi:hypothetical protein